MEDVANCLRERSVAELFDIFPPLVTGAGVTGPRGMDFGPTIDGYVLGSQPFAVIERGDQNAVPTVFGTNADEAANLLGGLTVDSQADYQETLENFYGGAGDAFIDTLLTTYPADDYENPQQALIQVVTDQRFTCPNRVYARRMAASQDAPVYRYLFTRNAELPRGERPAQHGIELVYVFGTLNDITGYIPAADDSRMSELLIDYWTYFGHNQTFEAVAETEGLITWPEYTEDGDEVMVLDVPLSTQVGVRNAKCDVWNQYFGL